MGKVEGQKRTRGNKGEGEDKTGQEGTRGRGRTKQDKREQGGGGGQKRTRGDKGEGEDKRGQDRKTTNSRISSTPVMSPTLLTLAIPLGM